MAQKRRPSKQEGFEYLTVMVPAEFRSELVKQAETEGRTLSDVTRERLLRPLAADQHLSPARAIGRLVELLADDLAAYSQSADEWHSDMRAAVPALIGELFGGVSAPAPATIASSNDSRSFAEIAARALGQKVRRAHLPRSGDFWADAADRAVAQVQPSLAKLQQDELLKIQQALGLSPEGLEKAPAVAKRASGKGQR
jgi:hypothetical protein